jgi:hypothetical protein
MMIYVFIIKKKVADCVQQQYLYIMTDGYRGLKNGLTLLF